MIAKGAARNGGVLAPRRGNHGVGDVRVHVHGRRESGLERGAE